MIPPFLNITVDLLIADPNMHNQIYTSLPDGGAIGYRLNYLGWSGTKEFHGVKVFIILNLDFFSLPLLRPRFYKIFQRYRYIINKCCSNIVTYLNLI